MKFSYAVGNPPYQKYTNKNNRMEPIYPFFMDLSEKVAKTGVMIHPARFLFNAGETPKSWNRKKLEDTHFKVLLFEPTGHSIFPGTNIKGGIAITCWDKSKDFGAIREFISNPILSQILKKVNPHKDSLSGIHFNRSSYKLTDILYAKNPARLKKVKFSDRLSIASNIFQKFPELFVDNKVEDNSIGVLGREGKLRKIKFIKSDYIENHQNLYKWKVFLAKSNGTGTYGEILGPVEIGPPGIIATQTFISFGAFNTKAEAIHLSKYLKTKFLRALLGIKKATADNARKEIWKYIPLQDFSSNSDIDWTLSISEIDQQLYRKYELSNDEIEFIETYVKEMS